MRVWLGCFGCEIRHLDTQRIIDYLEANGISRTEDMVEADLLVVITCAVSRYTEDRSLALVSEAARSKRDEARLLVGGCLPSISPERLERIDVDHVFSPRDMERLDEYLHQAITRNMRDVPIPNRSPYDVAVKEWTEGRTPRERYDRAKRGYKIVITHGCLGNCTFCVVRNATGRTASVPLHEVLEQVSAAVAGGESTIMLRGGDTGSYGCDTGSNLPQLLSRVLSLAERTPLFVHDCNVNWIIRDFQEYVELVGNHEHKRSWVSLNVPIQSGSDRILELMKRPYTTDVVVRVLAAFRNEFPWIELGTHVMVGFPGETDSDFCYTLEMIEGIGFEFITCFPYSEHHDAGSANLPDKVPADVQKGRIAELVKRHGDLVKVVE